MFGARSHGDLRPRSRRLPDREGVRWVCNVFCEPNLDTTYTEPSTILTLLGSLRLRGRRTWSPCPAEHPARCGRGRAGWLFIFLGWVLLGGLGVQDPDRPLLPIARCVAVARCWSASMLAAIAAIGDAGACMEHPSSTFVLRVERFGATDSTLVAPRLRPTGPRRLHSTCPVRRLGNLHPPGAIGGRSGLRTWRYANRLFLSRPAHCPTRALGAPGGSFSADSTAACAVHAGTRNCTLSRSPRTGTCTPAAPTCPRCANRPS